MTEKEYHCACCKKELEVDKPVFQDMFGNWYCSKHCLTICNYDYYPTLREILAETNKKVCKACDKDLTHVDRIYVDYLKNTFCSTTCLTEWNTDSEFCSWEEYYQYYFK
ncbi:hypothetical protein [Lactobacillus jensenii]|uniref:Uncharacterized protein n=1 Tax=Lactobacillus jensenii TaxID=109790 RepID=A0ABU9FHA8_LACJE|nr:hypothetical protein [Lactobacillus jensenii]MCW8071734.1 hypothetical protein [Lactobacillus jensenii]MDK8236097.1 hypothetical protein [Lactobacillus jensenii]MDT9544385.1 hypothetical protein [Lactobacillus jensenii]MDT9586778.1 hypothetical protein [Lactobacillus jensenii]MDX5078683.1 hypothetical protein [Lactobacillus jensenii]